MESKISRPQQTPHRHIFNTGVYLDRPTSIRLITLNSIQKASTEHNHLIVHYFTCLLSTWSPEMLPVTLWYCFVSLQTGEISIWTKLMLGCDSITVSWNNLRVIFNSPNHIGQSLQFSIIFFWNFFILIIFLYHRFDLILSLFRWRLRTFSLSFKINKNSCRITHKRHWIELLAKILMLN